MRNIVLLGFMGTGKTTIAKNLAKLSGMRYVSTDDLIEKEDGASIGEIFKKKGEAYFRKIEEEIVLRVSEDENVVIDAGGGVVLNAKNMENLKKKGILVCLWAEPEDIFDRTKKHTHRPLLNIKNSLDKIRELLNARKPYYERADYHVNTGSVSIEEAVEAIIGYVRGK